MTFKYIVPYSYYPFFIALHIYIDSMMYYFNMGKSREITTTKPTSFHCPTTRIEC